MAAGPRAEAVPLFLARATVGALEMHDEVGDNLCGTCEVEGQERSREERPQDACELPRLPRKRDFASFIRS